MRGLCESFTGLLRMQLFCWLVFAAALREKAMPISPGPCHRVVFFCERCEVRPALKNTEEIEKGGKQDKCAKRSSIDVPQSYGSVF